MTHKPSSGLKVTLKLRNVYRNPKQQPNKSVHYTSILRPDLVHELLHFSFSVEKVFAVLAAELFVSVGVQADSTAASVALSLLTRIQTFSRTGDGCFDVFAARTTGETLTRKVVAFPGAGVESFSWSGVAACVRAKIVRTRRSIS